MPKPTLSSLHVLPAGGHRFLRNLWRWLRGELYRPERHYMRGSSRR